MLELGTDSDRCHEEVGKFAASYHVDRLFVFGNFATHISAGAQMGGMKKDNISVYSDINKLNEDLLHFLKTGDVVLVKGSRGMKMERVSDFLKDEIGVE
jgi:UDP-N-acetylmuramoyl-tripeptide--D-alanyl-D-alanine ligase